MRSGLANPSQNLCWRADLVTITLLGGTVYRWTTCDRPLTVGVDVYTPGPILSRTYRQGTLPEIDTFAYDLAGTFKIGGYSIALLASRGLFDDARVNVDHVRGAYAGDLSWSVTTAYFEGRVSSVEPAATTLKMSVAAETETLSFLHLPRFLYQASCGHVVYDANCGLNKAALTVAGTVTGAPTATAFSASGAGITGKADNYFNLGVVAFDITTATAALRGVRRAVSDFVNSTDTFTVGLPLPAAPAAGDTFTAFPGCRRDFASCTAFANTAAFRGFRHIPVSEGGL